MQVLTLTLPESSGKVQRILRRGPQECTNSRDRLQPVNPSAARTLLLPGHVRGAAFPRGAPWAAPFLGGILRGFPIPFHHERRSRRKLGVSALKQSSSLAPPSPGQGAVRLALPYRSVCTFTFFACAR